MKRALGEALRAGACSLVSALAAAAVEKSTRHWQRQTVNRTRRDTMIIRSLTRRPGAFQTLARNVSACRAPYARRLHGVPSLLNHDELVQNGIPGLFSKKQFDVAYTQYQGHIMDELNISTSGQLRPQLPRREEALC